MKTGREYIAKCQENLAEINELQVRISETNKRVVDKENSLENVIDKSDRQLQELLTNFDEQMEVKARERDSLQHEIDKLGDDIKTLRVKSDELSKQEGLAIATRQQLDKAKADALACVVDSGCRGSSTWTESFADEAVGSLRAKVQSSSLNMSHFVNLYEC